MLCALAVASAVSAQVTAVFNWEKPSTLTPAYSAPTSSAPSGEYISNVTFTNNGVSFKIIDDDVKELSRRARFYFGYNTQTVEMRAYLDSEIVVTAPDGMAIESVEWQGAKVGSDYLTALYGTWNGTSWHTDNKTNEPGTMSFYVDATINCTSVTVRCTPLAGVEDIAADAARCTWYTMQGTQLDDEPSTHGIYICRKAQTISKVIR